MLSDIFQKLILYQIIIITSINPEGKTNEDTMKILFEEIKPSDLGIKPDRITKNGKKGVDVGRRPKYDQ